ncbi:replication factor-A protein 1 [Enterocytozoon bieneusi H348]|nr:replication factor-A protein 1 [Enterocytozoon bieneusi H348]|eukprot:XP_002650118.1 replication factor-A protein 1 [Enterocytozoon bieneusi H348]
MELNPETILTLYKQDITNPLYKNPIVQISSLGKINTGDGKLRYKLVLSDGKYFMRGIFSSDVSMQVEMGIIKNYTIIQIGSMTVKQKDTTIYLLISSIIQYEHYNELKGTPISISSDALQLSKNVLTTKISENHINKLKRPVEDDKIISKKEKTNNEPFTPIKDINPFLINWKIQGRILQKTNLKKFNNKNGEGKVFSFEIMDETEQIKVICFGDAAEMFYPLIENNQIYSLTHGQIKMANKRFNTNNCDYEIHLDTNSIIELCNDASNIPMISFKFKKINELSLITSLVDIVGIIKEIYPIQNIITKSDNREISKRDILVIDETGYIKVTLWGDKALQEYQKDSVICLKGFKVIEYNGINLGSVSSSQVVLNSMLPEVIKLVKWYETEGKEISVEKTKIYTKRYSIANITESNIEYGIIHGTITYIKEDNLYYMACPTDGCSKKVIQEDLEHYRCEKCNNVFKTCNYRYMTVLGISDFTGQLWINVFNDVAKQIFNISAEDLHKLKEIDSDNATKLVKNIIGKEFAIKVRVVKQIYNEETIKRINCLELDEINLDQEIKLMTELIQ